MSYDDGGRTVRPTPRSSGSRGGGSAPMGSTVAIVVTAVAVLLAFFIMRKVTDDGSASTANPGTQATIESTLADDPNASTIPPPPTTSASTKVGTSVQVVNCSNQEGVARVLSNALGAEGFTTVEPDTGTTRLPVTKIIYNPDDAAALNVANTLSTYLANAVVEPSGPNVPTLLGAWAPGSAVIVLLGSDLAGKSLVEIAGGGSTSSTSTP